MMDLSQLYDEMTAAAERQSLLIFPGYVSDDLPLVWWQGDPENWPDFIGIAKAEGMRTVFVGRAVLEEDDLRDLAEWVEEHSAGSSNGDRARLKDFERYIGATGEIRLGYIKDGVAYVLQHRTEWYEDFLDLMEEVDSDEDEEFGG